MSSVHSQLTSVTDGQTDGKVISVTNRLNIQVKSTRKSRRRQMPL